MAVLLWVTSWSRVGKPPQADVYVEHLELREVEERYLDSTGTRSSKFAS
jgi:hypothetical protein